MKAGYKGKALGFLAGAGMLVSQATDAGDTGTYGKYRIPVVPGITDYFNFYNDDDNKSIWISYRHFDEEGKIRAITIHPVFTDEDIIPDDMELETFSVTDMQGNYILVVLKSLYPFMYNYDIDGDGVIKPSEVVVDPNCKLDGDEIPLGEYDGMKYNPWLNTPKPETLPPKPEFPPKMKPKKDDERFKLYPGSSAIARNHARRARDSI